MPPDFSIDAMVIDEIEAGLASIFFPVTFHALFTDFSRVFQPPETSCCYFGCPNWTARRRRQRRRRQTSSDGDQLLERRAVHIPGPAVRAFTGRNRISHRAQADFGGLFLTSRWHFRVLLFATEICCSLQFEISSSWIPVDSMTHLKLISNLPLTFVSIPNFPFPFFSCPTIALVM